MDRPRKLVVFSDGTGNSAAKLNKTNVWRAYQALDLAPGSAQIAFYDDGVGNSTFRPLALLGGAIGLGLARNVKEIYSFLCRNYRPGDEICAFGFSRGSFTIRILVSLIKSQGLILDSRNDVDLARRVATAYRRYRANYHTVFHIEAVPRWTRDACLALFDAVFRRSLAPPPDPEAIKRISVRFLGLWDTVDAYGLPIEEMTRAWDNFIWPLSMRDHILWGNVRKACHALALDDERNVFHPLLWNEEYEPQDAAHTDQERITQVWFAGAHANVGGGYPNDALAMVPLLWMIGEAEKAGLVFVPQVIAGYRALADTKGPIYDPRSGSGSFYRYNPRLVERLCRDRKMIASLPDAFRYAHHRMRSGRAAPDMANKGVLIRRPKLHHSVFERLLGGVDRYAPIVLPFDYGVVRPGGGITASFAEDHDRIGVRRHWQEQVWNVVWLRRIVYYATITIVIALLVLPFLAEAQKAVQPNALFPLLTFGQSFLPGFASTWTDYLLARPGAAFKVLAAFGLLLYASALLKRAISGKMHIAWRRLLFGEGAGLPSPGCLSRAVTAIRKHPVYHWFFYDFLKKGVAQLLAVSLFAALAVMATSRVWYVMGDSYGAYCLPLEESREVPLDSDEPVVISRAFRAQDACFNTGLLVSREFRYQVELTVAGNTALKDGSYYAFLDRGLATYSDFPTTGSRGLFSPDLLVGQPDFLFALASPLKRVWSARYMKPIARISASRGEEHVLEPVGPSRNRNRIVAEFTAGRSGPLFLYLNDAILFAPCAGSFGCFYGNNAGDIRVRVRAVTSTQFPPDVKTVY